MKRLRIVLKQFRTINSIFADKERRGFHLLIIIMVFSSLLEMVGIGAISPLLSLAVDSGDNSTDAVRIIARITGLSGTALFYFVCIGFIVLTVVKNAFSLFSFVSRSRFYTRLNRTLSTKLMKRYLSESYVWFLNKNSSDFPRLIISEVAQISQKVINSALIIISNLILTLGIIVLLGLQNWLMSIVVIFSLGGLYLLLYFIFKSRLKFLGAKRFRLDKERFTLLNNVYSGIKEVKIREKETFYMNRFTINARSIARNSVRQEVYVVIPRYIVETIVFCFFGLLLLLLKSGNNSLIEHLPTLTLYALAGYRLLPNLQQISRSFNAIVTGMESLRKLKDDLKGETTLPENGDSIIHLNEFLALRNICYTYPETDREIFHDFDLSIKHKEKIGIIGFSGSGKTTLLNLIMGLLEPQSGYLQVDDTVLNRENLSGWRRNLGLVSQEVYLLDGTVAENIAFGENPTDIDRGRLENAARAAEIHETILSLPEGYETEVGERGIRLSGGQAQRIVIARALYHEPDVLIFDEATSAMDNLTEKAIMDSIDRLSGEKTIIIVAHRLTTVKKCDRIILLKEGRIINQGSYDYLLTNDANFRRLAMENDTEE